MCTPLPLPQGGPTTHTYLVPFEEEDVPALLVELSHLLPGYATWCGSGFLIEDALSRYPEGGWWDLVVTWWCSSTGTSYVVFSSDAPIHLLETQVVAPLKEYLKGRTYPLT